MIKQKPTTKKTAPQKKLDNTNPHTKKFEGASSNCSIGRRKTLSFVTFMIPIITIRLDFDTEIL